MNAQQFKQWCISYSQINHNIDNIHTITSDLSRNPHVLPKPLIMGILNVTPDSFSDGNCFCDLNLALDKAYSMLEEGADIIDIGGESSRPNAVSISEEEELRRVIPIIQELSKEKDVCISIDTIKAGVMRQAVDVGASFINDIYALQAPGALAMASALNVPVCLMHMQNIPEYMQNNPSYNVDVLEDINLFFEQRIKACLSAGIKRTNLLLDPGFGFGKLPQHNLRIIKKIACFKKHNLPIMLGASRKSTLGLIQNKKVTERLFSGLTVALFSVLEGAAIIRTHDVKETKEVFSTLNAIQLEAV